MKARIEIFPILFALIFAINADDNEDFTGSLYNCNFLHSKLQNVTLGLCAANIRSGDITSATTIFQSLKNGKTHLREIVSRSYSKSNDAENVVYFANNLNSLEDKATVFDALITEITRNYDMNMNYPIFMIGTSLKKAMVSNDFQSNADLSLQNNFKRLKGLLPSAVRTAIWKDSVCILSKHFQNEVLAASSDNMSKDNDRRNIFTWKTTPPAGAGEWILEPDATGRYFAIKNKLYGEYMYAAANDLTYDHSRRSIFTWRPKTHFEAHEWEFYTVKNGAGVYLKSKNWKEYVYPVIHNGDLRDDQRRYIFSWREIMEDPSKSTQYEWLITDCS